MFRPVPSQTALSEVGLRWRLLDKRHDSQASRLFLPRALSIGCAAWRVLSGGENQPFAMPVWERRIFFKKPLASGRVFDIFSAPFRPKDGTDSMIADR
jgi:predicted ATPase